MFLKKLAIRQQKMWYLRDRKQRRRTPKFPQLTLLKEFLSFSLGSGTHPEPGGLWGSQDTLGFVEQSNREESFSEGKSEPCRGFPLNLPQRNDQHMNVKNYPKLGKEQSERTRRSSDIHSGLGRVPALPTSRTGPLHVMNIQVPASIVRNNPGLNTALIPPLKA